jgi:hypothetical protein
LKPKPKKRRKDKRKKNHTLIHPEFILEVGGKIIHQKAGSEHILITTNSRYYKKWALFSLLGGAAFSAWLFKVSSGSFSSDYAVVIGAPFLLFSFVALTYYRRAIRIKKFIIDLSNQTIITTSNIHIPFDQVSLFFITSLPTAQPNSTYDSYQLNLLLTNNDECLLITSDSYEFIERAAIFLSDKTNITLKEGIEPA